MIHKSYIKAETVLQIFDVEYGNEQEYYSRTYHNGRENGFAITRVSDKKTAYISDFRRSDEIVVYLSNMYDDNITPQAYDNKMLFKYDEYQKVVKYIHQFLKKEEK